LDLSTLPIFQVNYWENTIEKQNSFLFFLVC
jgi:hypothetical protein